MNDERGSGGERLTQLKNGLDDRGSKGEHLTPPKKVIRRWTNPGSALNHTGAGKLSESGSSSGEETVNNGSLSDSRIFSDEETFVKTTAFQRCR